ncbi:Crp/Fnr family transcriptional regulator [Anaerosporobacter sp.]
MDVLIEYFQKYGIEKNLANKFTQFFYEKKYPKGSTILSMGENTQTVCFIKEGIVRGFYINTDGNDITKCFSTEGSWCCIYNMLRPSPSEFWIEALEDCIMIQISVDKLKHMINTIPESQRLYTKLCLEAFIHSDNRNVNFQKMKAVERYLLFIHQYPDLEKRVKQEYIASYIGITPSSLSRIKRNL